MELRQLEYFLMVSKTNSFTRAAERLYVSQPAVTNAIRSLEEELGIQLFDRNQKQAILTTEGQVFCKHVENIMRGVSTTIFEINELKNLNNGVLTLAITPIAGTRPIPMFLKMFKKQYPNIKLSFIEGNVPEIQTLLIEDKADLGIVILGDNNILLDYTRLGSQELVVCCSKEHCFQRKNSIELSELVNEPLILLTQNCLLRKLIIKEFERLNTLPQIAFESNHIQTIKSLVACNAGLTILPQDLCDTSLITIPLNTPVMIDIAIAIKKNKALSHAAQAFLDLAKETFV
ncbi:LysR family transcriptional regulator [Pelosinus sp. IPA-1]|uniref:LysR family transcriptional regulator n=1 Tax=Pelosinus sp. IPA-1 TaxID=3029569 RepID=UPI00243614EC|nr:LysR family transcriptional regulator [Pelosinus sp. IPA-1]GMA97237.1 LysR family transcriptional regulator [Pelosinus sp. IPA-1]